MENPNDEMFDLLGSFDYFESIEHKKELLLSLHQYNNSFEEAVQASIHITNENIKNSASNRSYYYNHLIEKDSEGINFEVIADESELINKITEYSQREEWYEDQLHSLYEMRVISIFKSLEISMKSLIKRAYPKVDVRGLFKWENMKSFFNERGIKLEKLTGYLEIQDLKKLNNSFKHTDELNEDVLKISEFKKEYSLENVDLFIARVEPKTLEFQKELVDLVIKELYEFDDNKINKIADDIKDRMEKVDALRLIESLRLRYE